MTHRSRLAAAVAVALVFVAACGQSGPLYIPGDPSRMTVPPENPENIQQTEGAVDDEDSEGSPE